MKTKLIISALVILVAVVFSCKKTPEIPKGNKIKFGQTSSDSVGYYGANVTTVISGLNKNEILQHGHCWRTISAPTVEDSKTVLVVDIATDTFTSQLSNLLSNTNYFIRPYVTIVGYTLYGDVYNINTFSTAIPKVTTKEITNITINSATCNYANDDGGLNIITRGVCWTTSGSPSLDNNTGITNDDTGIGNFSSQLEDLSENTTLYVAAYATNEKGTNYGEALQFKTLELLLPSITTTQPTDITATTAICGGDVTNDGNGTVTARGVCWSLEQQPTLQNCLGYTSDGVGVGNFTSSIINLELNKNYYYRAYATNEVGSSYGNEFDFITYTLYIDCSTLNGVIAQYRVYNDWFDWFIGDDGFSGQCWTTANNAFGGYAEFQQYFHSEGYLEFWFNTFASGSPNSEPSIYVNGVKQTDPVMIGGSTSSWEWEKLRTSVIPAGNNTIRIQFADWGTMKQISIDEIEIILN